VKQSGAKTSSSTNIWKRVKWIGTWSITVLGLALGLYVVALSGLIIAPWWSKGNNMILTIVFIVVAFIALAVAFVLAGKLHREKEASEHYYDYAQRVFAKQNKKIKALREARQVKRGVRK
jgi:hypothetical protein